MNKDIDVNSPHYLHFCNGCKTLKPNSEYRNYNKFNNIRKFASKCNKCADIINSKYVANNKERVAKIKHKHYKSLSKDVRDKRNKEYISKNYISPMFQTLKWNAKKRGLSVEIDTDYIKELYEKQNKKCYYTGKPMTLIKGDRDNVISVDRLDSSKHYTKDNVVLCCLKVNIVKNDLTYEELIKLCKILIKEYKNKIDEK